MNKLPMPEWLAVMERVREIRSNLYYSGRARFDDELRPITDRGLKVSYPDAIYYVTDTDFRRALAAVQPEGTIS